MADSGLIHSHNYPQNYDPHDDCVYLIQVDSFHRLNLTFTDFDINAVDGNCSNGYVKVIFLVQLFNYRGFLFKLIF